ncbi:YlxR family protein [Mycoplasmopsis sturni]|uniref:YlxR family protein n=1 Tax=Mycoplasmopsis sturni TaxID=39047 RepID=UPI00055EC244|nr:YlxR family protein [Mycoplasmopsis sturni]
MIKNKNFTRKCIATNQIVDVSQLVRFDLNKNKEIRLDLKRELNGRGAYMIYSPENWAKIKKTKALNRVFRFGVSPEKYLEIEQELLEVYNEQKEQQN